MYFDTCTKNKESINETICPAYHIEPLEIELLRLASKLDLIGLYLPCMRMCHPPIAFPFPLLLALLLLLII